VVVLEVVPLLIQILLEAVVLEDYFIKHPGHLLLEQVIP
jgi:hypothetical protein